MEIPLRYPSQTRSNGARRTRFMSSRMIRHELSTSHAWASCTRSELWLDHRQPTNPPTHQPTNPPTHQPTNPPTHQPTNPPTHQACFRRSCWAMKGGAGLSWGHGLCHASALARGRLSGRAGGAGAWAPARGACHWRSRSFWNHGMGVNPTRTTTTTDSRTGVSEGHFVAPAELHDPRRLPVGGPVVTSTSLVGGSSLCFQAG